MLTISLAMPGIWFMLGTDPLRVVMLPIGVGLKPSMLWSTPMALSELAGVLGSFLARSPATFGCDQPRPFLIKSLTMLSLSSRSFRLLAARSSLSPNP